jgi:hypothetical protein
VTLPFVDSATGPTTDSADIRDAAMAIIDGLGLFKETRVVASFQWQPSDLPACGVYLQRETAAPLGDLNAGEPDFMHEAVIGISILAKSFTEDELVVAVDRPVKAVLRALLTNPDFLKLFNGVSGVSRSPTLVSNAEGFISETRLEITVEFPTVWVPYVPDDFETVVMTTRPLGTSGPAITTRFDVTED